MIKAHDIEKSFNKLQVLKGIELEVHAQEIVSIVGPSGAGKSTLMHIIGTLDKADKGSVLIDNIDISSLNPKKLAAFRSKNIGFIFQNHHLLPEFSAIENVSIPALIAHTNKSTAFKKAGELLSFLGLKERLHHKPSELSGGEMQRIAVARALINQPKVVLADEPSGNLDSANAASLHQLFFDLRDRFQQTFVIVTHNNQLAEMSDRTIKMKDGEIIG